MRLRICDGQREQIVPASIETMEQAFAPGASLRLGTEITLSNGERWLTAIALGAVKAAEGEIEQFLLSSAGDRSSPRVGRVGRGELLDQFRKFLDQGGPAADAPGREARKVIR
jgi:hypothetical protein